MTVALLHCLGNFAAVEKALDDPLPIEDPFQVNSCFALAALGLEHLPGQ